MSRETTRPGAARGERRLGAALVAAQDFADVLSRQRAPGRVATAMCSDWNKTRTLRVSRPAAWHARGESAVEHVTEGGTPC
jgi:hypothetical protein